jgi:hypothetical protein
MSITKTVKVQTVEVFPPVDDTAELTENSRWPTISVIYIDVFTDPDDPSMPIRNSRSVSLCKYTHNEETDVSFEDTLVQNIAETIWS